MPSGWDSAAVMARYARAATLVAVVAYAFGLVALLIPMPFAVPAFITGTTAVVIAMFAGFRASHLREIARDQ